MTEINVKKGTQGFIKGLPSWFKGKQFSKEHIAKIRQKQIEHNQKVRDALFVFDKYKYIEENQPTEIKIGRILYERKRENKPYLMIGLILGAIFGIGLTVAGFYIARYNNPWPIYTVLLHKQIVGNWTNASATAYSNGICKGIYKTFKLPDTYNGQSINLTPTFYDCYNINSGGPLILRRGFIRG